MAKRNVVPVELSSKKGHVVVDGDAKSVITRVARELGMKEIVLTSRIYLWFAEQDEVVQKGVLRLLPKGYEAEVCRLALERLAAGGSKGSGGGKKA